jgi:hypothetical protein
MGGISVKLHREFSARSARGGTRPLREMGSLLETSGPRGFTARASVGVSRALLLLFQLALLLGGFFASALAFAYLSRRW